MNLTKTLCEALENTLKIDNTKGIVHIDGYNNSYFLSYNDLYTKALKSLNFLRKIGLKRNDELIIQIENPIEFLIVFWACLFGNIIPVPIAVANQKDHIKKVLKISKILKNPYMISDDSVYTKFKDDPKKKDYTIINDYQRKFIDIEELSKSLDDINNQELKRENIKPNDIAFIQFSSGSTSDPKGVVLTHNNLIINVNDIILRGEFVGDDSVLSWMPLTHDMGLIGFHLVPLVKGINQYILLPKEFIRSPKVWLDKINEYRITVTGSPNFGYKYFLKKTDLDKDANWDLSCLRLIFNGAEPISKNISEMFLKSLSKFQLSENSMFPSYGLAEASLAVALHKVNTRYKWISVDRNYLKIGSKIETLDESDKASISFIKIGETVLNCNIKICDFQGKKLGENIIGFIMIKGGNVTNRYYNNTVKTMEIIDQRGWLKTGDLGFIIGKEVVITGRYKDIIFWNGVNYYAHDIEEEVSNKVGIELGKIAACGINSIKSGQDDIIVFVVYKKDKKSFDELALKIRKIIGFELGLYIKYVIPVKKIPKTTSGKIQRYKLKNEFIEGKYDELKSAIAFEIIGCNSLGKIKVSNKLKLLLEICKKELKVKYILPDDNIFSIGGDSLSVLAVITKLKKYGYLLFDKDFYNEKTFYDLANKIKKYKRENEIVNEADIKIPLYPFQKWFFFEFGKDTNWNISTVIYHKSGYNTNILKEVLNYVTKNHSILQSRFEFISNTIFHNPNAKIKVKLDKKSDLYFIKNYYLNEIENTKLIEKIQLEVHSGINIERGPLISFGLIKAIDGDFLYIVVHHLVSDQYSLNIIASDIKDTYNQYIKKKKIENLQKTAPYAYVANVMYRYSMSNKILKELNYWQNLMKNKTKQIPIDFEISKDQRIFKNIVSINDIILEKSVYESMLLYCKDYKLKVNEYLIIALSKAIKIWTGLNSTFLYLLNNGRNFNIDNIDITRTVGPFVSAYPIYIEFNEMENNLQFIKYIKDILRNIPNQGLTFTALKELRLKEKRNVLFPNNMRIVDILFNFLGNMLDNIIDEKLMKSKLYTSLLKDLEPSENFIQDKIIEIHFFVRNKKLEIVINYNKKEFLEKSILQFIQIIKLMITKLCEKNLVAI